MRKYTFISRATRILPALLALACVAPPAPPAPRPDTRINAPFSTVWDAVVDRFARSSVPIKTIDRSSGLIAAEATRLPGKLDFYAGCNLNGFRNIPPVGATFNVLIKGDSTRSSVVVTADWIGLDGAGGRIGCVTTGQWEQEFEAAIKAKAEAH